MSPASGRQRIALVYPRLSHQTRSFLVPLGLIGIATRARDDGHDVAIIDSSFDRDLGPALRRLRDFRPDVVGLSLSTDLYPNARVVCDAARGMGAITVMGGPHPTVCPDEIWADCASLDVIVPGEGEGAFSRLLASQGDFREVPGIIHRSQGRVLENAPAAPTDHPAEYRMPDRSLLPTYARYSASGYTGLILTRGCPYGCRFCQPALRKIAGEYRIREPAAVADEIEYLHKRWGNRRFHVDDDIFTLNRAWVAAISAELDRRHLRGRLRFIVLSRVDTFDDDLARLLREMGVYYVMFGVESGSREVLDSFDKRTTEAGIEAAFRRARAWGFKTHAFVILGSPSETRESLHETERLVDRIRPTSVFVSQYAPLPGTWLREELQAAGRLNVTSHEQMSYFAWAGDSLPVHTPGVTRAEVVAARDRIVARQKAGFWMDNAVELAAVVMEKRSLRPAFLHASFYLKKRHFTG